MSKVEALIKQLVKSQIQKDLWKLKNLEENLPKTEINSQNSLKRQMKMLKATHQSLESIKLREV